MLGLFVFTRKIVAGPNLKAPPTQDAPHVRMIFMCLGYARKDSLYKCLCLKLNPKKQSPVTDLQKKRK